MNADWQKVTMTATGSCQTGVLCVNYSRYWRPSGCFTRKWCVCRLTVGEYFELLLQSDGGVVCPEDLGSQTRHERTQVLVQHARLQWEMVNRAAQGDGATITNWNACAHLVHWVALQRCAAGASGAFGESHNKKIKASEAAAPPSLSSPSIKARTLKRKKKKDCATSSPLTFLQVL